MPLQLARTLKEVRDLEVSLLGTKGIPNPWWPWAPDPNDPHGWEKQNDCMKFQAFCLGIAKRSDMANPVISIGAFLGTSAWARVSVDQLRPGDLPLMQFDDRPDIDHIGFTYSIDRAAGEITTLEANTSPRPGVKITESNRAVYRKTRSMEGNWLTGGIRPLYRPVASTVTPKRQAYVRLLGSWLNQTMPDHVGSFALPRTGAGRIGKDPGDGIEGPFYWGLIQAWGRTHDAHGRKVEHADASLYGPGFLLDRIEGRRTEYVEGVAYQFAKAA